MTAPTIIVTGDVEKNDLNVKLTHDFTKSGYSFNDGTYTFTLKITDVVTNTVIAIADVKTINLTAIDPTISLEWTIDKNSMDQNNNHKIEIELNTPIVYIPSSTSLNTIKPPLKYLPVVSISYSFA